MNRKSIVKAWGSLVASSLVLAAGGGEPPAPGKPSDQTFHVEDADIVVLDKLRDEEDEVFEDRVEVYLSRDDEMKDYYCFEVDSRGRVFDYHASYFRKFDTKWKFEGLETKASSLPGG